MNKGDYVLATKWNDGYPLDHWCIGFFDTMLGDRFMVVDSEGKQFRGNGFRRAKKISARRGKFLLDHKFEIEGSSRSLWFWVRTKMDAQGEEGGEG
jgi:hypothetical protein